MTKAQDAAIARVSDHENLVGELAELVSGMEYALWGTPSCQAGVVDRCRCRYCVTKRARAVLAKTKEGAQS